MKPRVYIETTIPSYLTAWPSRELIRAARQQITRDWWSGRGSFDLYVSRVVVKECQAGDPAAAADRLAAIMSIPLLEVTADAKALAAGLMRGVPLPVRAEADALHIAIAATAGMDYLPTWNCVHIANVAIQPRIASICRAANCEPPSLCTPLQLLAGRDFDA